MRLLGVLALLAGLVAMHGALAPSAAHGSVSATTTAPAMLEHPSGAVTADGPACPMDHHGQSVTAMDCVSTAATPVPGGTALAAPLVSHLLPPAALPQWPSPRAAAFAPPAPAPTHVILRT